MSLKRTVLLAAASAFVVASPAGAGGTATITISHQMHGCHMWQLGTGAPKPTLSITLSAGTVVRFVNNDVMPHKLAQLAGPKLALVRPSMKHMGAATSVELRQRGVYRFTTRPGEDYAWAKSMKTIGEDYVLQLRVRVK